MPYILILVTVLYSNSVHTQHIEFRSQEACEEARKTIVNTRWESPVKARVWMYGVCVPRGEKFK